MIIASKPRNARFSQIGRRPLARCDQTGGLVDEGEGLKESPLLFMAMQVSSQPYADVLSTYMLSFIDSLLERQVMRPNEGLYCSGLYNRPKWDSIRTLL